VAKTPRTAILSHPAILKAVVPPAEKGSMHRHSYEGTNLPENLEVRILFGYGYGLRMPD